MKAKITQKITFYPATFFLFCLWQLLCPNVAKADFTGKVIVVMDGDTIMVLNQRKKVKVRLQNIDAPERGQAYGEQARMALKTLIWHQQVFVEESGLDQYQRSLGVVYLNQQNINAELVKQGWAWVYGKYNMDNNLPTLEKVAHENGRGLWQEPAPTPPWRWRYNHLNH